MSETSLLGNGVVATSAGARVIADGAVVWRGDRILEVGPGREVKSRHADATFVDARGGLVIPGLINLHHHFYSALARGLDPGTPMRSFGEILEGLWWRLDRALTTDAVRLSAELSVADCLRWGCTTVFDHHASPACLRGSLDTIAKAAGGAGLRAMLCYEVSDRNGHHEAVAGIEENLDFISRHRHDQAVRGMLGLHASFTVADDTLAEAARRRPAASGCHIHLAEDMLDATESLARFGRRPLERLERCGLVDDRALLVHGVHLEPDELATIAAAGATLIHNPESNQNNGVGRLDLVEAAHHGVSVGLGTDGMSSAMLRSLRAAFLGLRAGRNDPAIGFDVVPPLLEVNREVARRFFDEPLLGKLVPGAPADIAVVDCPPPTPITGDNLFGHLVYGTAEAPVRHTIARGRLLVRDFRHTTVDPAELAREASKISPRLWQRFRDI